MEHYRASFFAKGRKLPRTYRFYAADRTQAEEIARRQLADTPGADDVVVAAD